MSSYEEIIARDGIIKGVHAGQDFGDPQMGIIDELLYGTTNDNEEDNEE